MSDDGAGLNTERIRQKAIEKGVIDDMEAMAMTDAQVHRLIFAPGFSTAAKVTNISGRGVGMDVVKTNVELIGGTIDLRSRYGHGSTFIIKIPLTLAIISALIVGVGEHRFALPQLSVIELVRAGQRSEHRIERINATRVLRLRDRLLPLVALSDVLNLMVDDPAEDRSATVVVMQVGETRFGLIVDEVFDTEEIVVKPLSKRLGAMSEYSGATILGDGSVIMILDPNGIARSVANVERNVNRILDEQAHAAATAPVGDHRVSLLLFSAGGPEPRACPLSLVTRLEEIDAAAIETTARGPVVQYRGRLMPVASAGGMIRKEGRQSLLVFSHGAAVVGLAVDSILDIVEETLDIQLGDQTPGVLGTAVIKGKSTEIIDVGHYLSQAEPSWAAAAAKDDARTGRKRILLIESHPFFRNLLAPMVSAAGYDVTVAEGLEEARARLAAGAAFDVVLADADGPGLEDARGAHIIPLSTRRDADAVPKSDRHALLDAIQRALRSGEAA